jgi:aminobenzoyl-glutamate utilization protein B
VQTKDVKYQPLMRPNERPATHLITDIHEKYRPQMRRFYYDPTKFGTYLEQLGVRYPTVRKSQDRCEETPAVP